MADYQEYRRHVLHRRWRRMFSTVLAFLMLVLLCGVWVLWRQLYPTRPGNKEPQVSLLEQTLPSTEWRSLSYTRQTSLTVQKLADGVTTAMDFRLASMPETQSDPVELSYFDTAVFLGDSLTQGMQIYDTGLPNAHYCAYRGVGPNAVVNGTTCTRVDGVQEIPLEADLFPFFRKVRRLHEVVIAFDVHRSFADVEGIGRGDERHLLEGEGRVGGARRLDGQGMVRVGQVA